MIWELLSIEQVIGIHDRALNPLELSGMAKDKSLDACLDRVINRVQYGIIKDEFDLAASYAMAIASGHCFNDANKRTAFLCMIYSLELQGIENNFKMNEVAHVIIDLAQGKIDEVTLAEWLRKNTKTV